jgi:hypothetical protein
VVAWGTRIDLAAAIGQIGPARLRGQIEKRLANVIASGKEHFGLVERHGASLRIKEKPPLIRHVDAHELDARRAFESYAETLQEDRRVLLDRYALQDVALKVVGVGSVGTFCAVGLFVSKRGSPLLLQIKEAQPSVLAPFAGASAYANQGQRVVVGQRMMQAATDVFLGWTQKPLAGREFYVRRLKDSRLADIGARIEAALPFYAILCQAVRPHPGARPRPCGRRGGSRRVSWARHRLRRSHRAVLHGLCRPDGARLEVVSARTGDQTYRWAWRGHPAGFSRSGRLLKSRAWRSRAAPCRRVSTSAPACSRSGDESG